MGWEADRTGEWTDLMSFWHASEKATNEVGEETRFPGQRQ
jgi:hypothetical protein